MSECITVCFFFGASAQFWLPAPPSPSCPGGPVPAEARSQPAMLSRPWREGHMLMEVRAASSPETQRASCCPLGYKQQKHKTQPLEMKDILVSMNQTTCVLEMRSVGLGEGGWKFPWGGLCLKFNMLFLSLKAPATASSCFVILVPLSVWWM